MLYEIAKAQIKERQFCKSYFYVDKLQQFMEMEKFSHKQNFPGICKCVKKINLI